MERITERSLPTKQTYNKDIDMGSKIWKPRRRQTLPRIQKKHAYLHDTEYLTETNEVKAVKDEIKHGGSSDSFLPSLPVNAAEPVKITRRSTPFKKSREEIEDWCTEVGVLLSINEDMTHQQNATYEEATDARTKTPSHKKLLNKRSVDNNSMRYPPSINGITSQQPTGKSILHNDQSRINYMKNPFSRQKSDSSLHGRSLALSIDKMRPHSTGI